MNIIKMLTDIDPSTLDHINGLIGEGRIQGSYYVTLSNTNEVLRGWWSLEGSDTRGTASIKFEISDIDKLEKNYKSIQ